MQASEGAVTMDGICVKSPRGIGASRDIENVVKVWVENAFVKAKIWMTLSDTCNCLNNTVDPAPGASIDHNTAPVFLSSLEIRRPSLRTMMEVSRMNASVPRWTGVVNRVSRAGCSRLSHIK